MGEENHDRQLRRARATYIGAKDRFLAALENFDNSGTPMDPGPDVEPYPWTGEQWATVRALLTATEDMADARRTWDGMRREWTAGTPGAVAAHSQPRTPSSGPRTPTAG
jgi:hypothetical protein